MSREGSQLADYYPILARAVSQLATDNAQDRQELYEHVRTILITQLRKDQRISALGIIDERIALESAILKLEAELPSLDERRPETFDTNIPLHDAHDEIENSFHAGIESTFTDRGKPPRTQGLRCRILTRSARPAPRCHRGPATRSGRTGRRASRRRRRARPCRRPTR